MKQRYFIKMICFATIFLFCMYVYTDMLQPYFTSNEIWATTSTYKGFYTMNTDTIDVLFLGSSHAATAFIPQEMYEKYSITSYNIGCEQQNLLVSYYWLKEALRFQKPSVVILDTYMLFEYSAGTPLNTQETFTRKAMDFMKWSDVKVEAVDNICSIDRNQSIQSYYFPHIRYHDRWKMLSKNDFIHEKLEADYKNKGYIFLSDYDGKTEYEPFEQYTDCSQEQVVPIMYEWLEKIHDLCCVNSIELILVTTPNASNNMERNATVTDIARQKGIDYIDFNDKRIYQNINYQFEFDNADAGHANVSGAIKLTDYIGQYIRDKNLIKETTDLQWETTTDVYHDLQKSMQRKFFKSIPDISTYFRYIETKQYDVIIEVNKNATVRKQLQEKGIFTSLKDDIIFLQNGYENVSLINIENTLEGSLDTVFGELKIYGTDSYGLYIDGEEYAVFSEKDIDSQISRVLFFEKGTNNLVYEVMFQDDGKIVNI